MNQIGTQQISVEHIRACGARLSEERGFVPSVQDVAKELNVTSGNIRWVVNNHRRTQEASWDSLHIRPGIVTKERNKLAEINAKLTNPRARTIAVHAVLELAEAREISSRTAQVLVYALISRQHLPETLDAPFAKSTHDDPHIISNMLHGYRRRGYTRAGIVGTIERDILHGCKHAGPLDPTGTRYRQLFADCVMLARTSIDHRLFSEFLQRKELHPTLTREVGAAVDRITNIRWPKEYKITPAHVSLLEGLITAKTEGTFRSLPEFAKSLELDYSGVHRALSPSKHGIPLQLRLLAGNKLAGAPDLPKLEQAVETLRNSPTLSPEQGAILRGALMRHRRAQDVLIDTEVTVLRAVFERQVAGLPIDTSSLSNALQISAAPIHTALYGRGARPGIVTLMNRTLHDLAEETRRQILSDLVPLDPRLVPHPLLLIWRIEPIDQLHAKQKNQIMSVLSKLLIEHPKLPILTVRVHEPRGVFVRALTAGEIAKVVSSLFEGSGKSIEAIRDSLTEAVGNRQHTETSETKLRRYLFGRSSASERHVSCVTLLDRKLRRSRPFTRAVAQNGNAASPTDANLMSEFLRSPLFGWAHRIGTSEDPLKAARTVGVYCATRPGTFREIAKRIANNAANDSAERRYYLELSHTLSDSAILLTSPQAVQALISHARGSDAIPGSITPLLQASQVRQVRSEDFATFLCNIFAATQWNNGLQLLEDLGALAYNRGPYHLKHTYRHYARLAYEKFLCRSFAEIEPLTLPETERYSLSRLIELRELRRQTQSADDRRKAEQIQGFFATYSVEAVVRKFCLSYMQTNTNSMGIPYTEMLDIAHNAVFDAARRYNPEEYERTGRKVASFNGLAVMTIKWAIQAAAEERRTRIQRAPVSIQDPYGDPSEGGTIEGTLSSPVAETNLRDDLRLDQLFKHLKKLPPHARRAIELRFNLGQSARGVKDIELDTIAEVLYQEKLTPEIFSRQRISQILIESISDLRKLALSGTPTQWRNFFKQISEKEPPEGMLLTVKDDMVQPFRGLNLRGFSSPKGERVIVDIDRILQNGKREFDVYVEIRDEEDQSHLGHYLLTVKSGKIVASDRVDTEGSDEHYSLE